MPKRPVTMVRNADRSRCAGMTGHDAEIGGHDAPKYASSDDLAVGKASAMPACTEFATARGNETSVVGGLSCRGAAHLHT